MLREDVGCASKDSGTSRPSGRRHSFSSVDAGAKLGVATGDQDIVLGDGRPIQAEERRRLHVVQRPHSPDIGHGQPPDEEGYGQLLAWALSLGAPAFAVEGCGSFGAGLARALTGAGMPVGGGGSRRRERRGGKSDSLDALRAARRLLAIVRD
jgi:hypothetical protein